MTERDSYTVPGLVRGLTVLQSFTPQRTEQTLRQLADYLGVTRSAAFRTVHTLVAEGFLLPVGDGHRYRLGPAVLRLSFGYLASRELMEVAQSPLESLRDAIDWSCHLGILDGRHVLYLIRFPASDGMSSMIHVGSRLPATRTAMGRVLLTQKTERQLRKMLSDQPNAFVTTVVEAWKKDQQNPVVTHLGSFETGLCSLAAPVYDMSGAVVAAISATKVTDAVPDDIKAEVLRVSNSISRGLGYMA